MTTEIEDLKANVYRLRQELRDANDAYLTALKASCEFQPGDIVLARNRDGVFKKAIVRGVGMYGDADWYRVSFAKKNGEWGIAERTVFNHRGNSIKKVEE